MPQIRGGRVEAVVNYCETLTTKEMGYHRLSQRVNNSVKKALIAGIHSQLCPVIGLLIVTKLLF